MKKFLVFAAVCFCLFSAFAAEVKRVETASLVLENIPEVPASLVERLNQYQNTRSASLHDWMPGGGMLIGTRFAETAQVHAVAQPMGMRRQVTFYGEPVQDARWSNGPAKGFYFSRDAGGAENYQFYFFDMETGQARLLTDGQSRNEDFYWAPASRPGVFAYSTTRRNGRDYDIVVASLDAPDKPLALLEREGAWGPECWSPDGKKIVLGYWISAEESSFHIWNMESGRIEPMRPETVRASFGSVRWAPDGKGLYYTSDEGSEFKHLRYLNLATMLSRPLTEDIPWDVEALEISPDGKRLAFASNEDGLSRLYLMDLRNWKITPAKNLPAGIVSGLRFSPDSRALGFSLSTSSGPGDVWSLDCASQRLTRWTESEVGGLDVSRFVEPELVHYPTFDAVDGRPRMIPAFYYLPKGASAQKPAPVVINIHGGPEAQSRPYFSPLAQYYLNEMGVAVLYPNVRGSRGYGKTYLGLDNGYLRENSVRDIGALLDWIKTRPELDASRVAVMGGSYGGYMTLACMTHYNDRLAGGIDTVGISNFVTFLENTSDYRRDLRRVEYGDERDPAMRDFLIKISPTTNARKITKPMFIAQGLNDPRVPAGEAEQIVATIRKNGGDAWYFLAKDEGHGFAKKSNRDLFQQATVLFLEKILKQ